MVTDPRWHVFVCWQELAWPQELAPQRPPLCHHHRCHLRWQRNLDLHADQWVYQPGRHATTGSVQETQVLALVLISRLAVRYLTGQHLAVAAAAASRIAEAQLQLMPMLSASRSQAQLKRQLASRIIRTALIPDNIAAHDYNLDISSCADKAMLPCVQACTKAEGLQLDAAGASCARSHDDESGRRRFKNPGNVHISTIILICNGLEHRSSVTAEILLEHGNSIWNATP